MYQAISSSIYISQLWGSGLEARLLQSSHGRKLKIDIDVCMASTVGAVVVHELHPQQSNLSVVRAILSRDVYWTEYVRTAHA